MPCAVESGRSLVLPPVPHNSLASVWAEISFLQHQWIFQKEQYRRTPGRRKGKQLQHFRNVECSLVASLGPGCLSHCWVWGLPKTVSSGASRGPLPFPASRLPAATRPPSVGAGAKEGASTWHHSEKDLYQSRAGDLPCKQWHPWLGNRVSLSKGEIPSDLCSRRLQPRKKQSLAPHSCPVLASELSVLYDTYSQLRLLPGPVKPTATPDLSSMASPLGW